MGVSDVYYASRSSDYVDYVVAVVWACVYWVRVCSVYAVINSIELNSGSDSPDGSG